MGLLVEGEWRDQWYDTGATQGRFVRQQAKFRNWVTPDGAPGPSGEGGFQAEAGRYHLYVAYACPWAHRALIYRALKGLEAAIDVSFVHWFMGEQGWSFAADPDGLVGDRLFGSAYLHQVYTRAAPQFTGRVTVPALWDTRQGVIVNNESSEIIRMLNSAFDAVGALPGDYYPAALRSEIDELNARIYDTLNNGVYKCGFATSQAAYDEAVGPLFDTLDMLEERLSKRRFLCGAEPTEADWRLFPTLLRFDLVYVGHFKCNTRRIVDYPSLWAYTRDLYQWPKIKGTLNLSHSKRHYYESHETINPHRIVPAGPELDFEAPHGRTGLGG